MLRVCTTGAVGAHSFFYLKKSIMKKLCLFLSTFLLLGVLNGCNVTEGEADCDIQFRVIFDYNTHESDAFTKQVDQVQLYLFDENKKLAYILDEPVNKQSEHCIITTSQVLPGKYYIVGVGQDHRITAKGHNFIVPGLTYESASLSELDARLPMGSTPYVSSIDINNFLIGTLMNSELEDQLIEVSHDNTYTIPVRKVTNVLRVVLLNKDAKLKDSYEISLHETEGNGWINYNYLSKPDKPITYTPYMEGIKELTPLEYGEHPLGNDPIDVYNKGYVAEFASSKLIANHPTLLTIKDTETQHTIAEIDVHDLLRLGLITIYDEKWGYQEYLDREDHYTISLFIENDAWLEVSVIVNGWVISLNDIDLYLK